MASTYTVNSGVEKIGAGEQAGTWGTTTNNNLDILDRAINGVGAITLSGTTHTLTTTDGTLSDGGFKVLVLGGSPSGTNTITIAPNDQDKVYIVQNGTNQTATFTQGSGANISVVAGSKKIIYADGAGSGAAVVDITDALDIATLRLGGTAITSTAAELNILDGVTSTATELNIVDGDTSVGTTAVAAGDGIVTNDGGTMRHTTAATFSTYFNANLYSAPSAITSTSTLTPSAAQSIYQRVDTSGGNVTLTLAVGSLAVGQYIIVDKTSTSNTLTMAYASNSQGISLSTACDFAFAIYNGTAFSFIESIKG
tara:strand:- start:806 stop:1738 length:933 start_codon:yes stop_codon:yes gene_type:complete